MAQSKRPAWVWPLVATMVIVAVFALLLVMILRLPASSDEPAVAPATTSTPALSRDARVAVESCIRAQFMVGASMPLGKEAADKAQSACDAATSQLDVDATPRARKVAALISSRMVDVAAARVAWTGSRDQDALVKLDVDETAWEAQVRSAMGP